MQLIVARVARAHGLRGELSLDVRTDDPATRLAPGALLHTDPDVGTLTISAVRSHQGRLLVAFAEVDGREAAERLRGVTLVVDVEASDEEDAWYPHELAGLRAEDREGREIGVIEGLEPMPAHDLLILRESGGARTLVPFVRAIVPVVDVPGGRVVLDPPGGLLASDVANLDVVRPDMAQETDAGEGVN